MSHAADERSRGEPVVLTPRECLALLATESVGRIAYTDQALPAITPVNYVLDGHAIVIRTSEGARIARAAADAVVAFEVDHLDRATRTGWSVVMVGDCHRLTEPGDIARAHGLALTTWAHGQQRNVFLRISAGIVTGRRLCGDDTCTVCTTAGGNGHAHRDRPARDLP